MKSLLIGTGRYVCKVYNYHDSQACGYTRSGVLPRIDGMVWEWFCYGMVMAWYWIEIIFGVAVWSYVIYSNPFVDHTLW
jgi:hypothetical protein